MSDIIQLLPDAIANQIAAGEVVQRPASALKELLENAVDAGATHIQVLIKEAGKQLIQVIDNGKGMSGTDARMSFERHATSKIRASEDLFAIKTFGFRGEALASIAAVAQVEMKTKRAADELGTRLLIEGSEVKEQKPAALPDGTAIAVKNLFFNVPARRNFLKSNAVEMRHLVEEFQRVALAHPEIKMSLHQQDMELYQLPASSLQQRIVALMGKQYRSQLIAAQEESPFLTISGFVGKPELARKTKGEQYLFVNHRYIRSPYLHHAVCTAYEGLIASDLHPFYVLFLEIDPKHIDINVHPTKTEIKFDDERTIYGVVKTALRQALGGHLVVPTIDFDLDVNFTDNFQKNTRQQETLDEEHRIEIDERTIYPDKSAHSSTRIDFRPGFQRPSARGWEKLFEAGAEPGAPAPKSMGQSSLDPGKLAREEETLTFASRANEEDRSSATLPKRPLLEKEQAGMTFQIDASYIVAQLSGSLVIIDQQAAHERILYERYMRQYEKQQGASQQCLFPQHISLHPADFALVMDIMEDLQRLGFELSVFGQDTLLIQGVPADVPVSDGKALFEGLLDQFKHFKDKLSLGTRETSHAHSRNAPRRKRALP
ncbi:DNA mismatch repair protein mutL [Nitritalea halalkaliphila LW7]|uniref:DNA mismatch repair protein MutL n=1 Tax=Nitritalea halalkaliphila LW7 TaxID=1189621 RepID=I5C2B2_9BACT|nr:DNA mismatch repair protein mutL [Nitritalea halalkaliphila LW7]